MGNTWNDLLNFHCRTKFNIIPTCIKRTFYYLIFLIQIALKDKQYLNKITWSILTTFGTKPRIEERIENICFVSYKKGKRTHLSGEINLYKIFQISLNLNAGEIIFLLKHEGLIVYCFITHWRIYRSFETSLMPVRNFHPFIIFECFSVGGLRNVENTSRDAQEVRLTIERSNLDRTFTSPWTPSAIQMVVNKDLEAHYR